MRKISFLVFILTYAISSWGVIETDHGKVYVPKGETLSLGAADNDLAFSSDSSGVATVDASGTVTGVSVGTATITGEDSFGSLCETWEVQIFEVKIKDFGTAVCDGVEDTPMLDVNPSTVPIENVQLEARNSNGGSTFHNYAGGPIAFKGNDKDIKVDVAHWYGLTVESCDGIAIYQVKGTYQVDGVTYNISQKNFGVAAHGGCVNGEANYRSWSSGGPTFVCRQVAVDRWEAWFTGASGSFIRNMDTFTTNITLPKSQYRQYIQAEEDYHTQQLRGTKGNVVNPALHWVPQNVINNIQNKVESAKTEADVLMKLGARFDAAVRDENLRSHGIVITGPLRCPLEAEAKANAVPGGLKYMLRLKCSYPNCP